MIRVYDFQSLGPVTPERVIDFHMSRWAHFWSSSLGDSWEQAAVDGLTAGEWWRRAGHRARRHWLYTVRGEDAVWKRVGGGAAEERPQPEELPTTDASSQLWGKSAAV